MKKQSIDLDTLTADVARKHTIKAVAKQSKEEQKELLAEIKERSDYYDKLIVRAQEKAERKLPKILKRIAKAIGRGESFLVIDQTKPGEDYHLSQYKPTNVISGRPSKDKRACPELPHTFFWHFVQQELEKRKFQVCFEATVDELTERAQSIYMLTAYWD